MAQYQEAATAIPRSLAPLEPSESLRSRGLEAAVGRQAPRRATLSRIFWAAAAVVLFSLIFSSLTDSTVKLRLEGPNGVVGQVRWEDRTVTLDVKGLPALAPGKVYQLWHIGPVKAPVPCRTFTLDGGALQGQDTMQYAIAQGHKFALTLEPAGGSTTPTMPILGITP